MYKVTYRKDSKDFTVYVDSVFEDIDEKVVAHAGGRVVVTEVKLCSDIDAKSVRRIIAEGNYYRLTLLQ